MKRLGIMMIAVAVAIIGMGIHEFSCQESEISCFAKDNIEALTNDNEFPKPWVHPDGMESGRFECGAKMHDGKKCTYRVISCCGGGKGCNPRPCSLHG